MPETQAGNREGGAAGAETPDILTRIVLSKEEEVARLRPARSDLRARAASAPPVRDFAAALAAPGQAAEGGIALIAEVKRRSPGAGEIRPDLDPADLAAEYEEAGASALSVLTDGPFFGGSLDDLARVRARVRIPLLRKDFTIVEEQVWEARAGGADAILLIARILDDAELRGLRETAEEVGLAALVEVHDVAELDRALASRARIVGINNRDLATFITTLETTEGLAARVPDDVLLVSESGIRTRDDVVRLGRAGADAILVGETLLRAGRPGAKVRGLLGTEAAPGPRGSVP